MTAARTLLQMAGADATPGPLSTAAVVVIDAQREYLDGRLPLPGAAPALEAMQQLLRRARAAGAPIIHVAHLGKAGGLFDPDGPGGQIADQVRPEPGETVITKGLPNAFAGTDLQSALKATGRTSLVVAGFMTHMCVSSTARAALDLGYRTTVIADATATRALPDPTGGPDLDPQQLQRASLAELADRFAVVAPLSALVD
ncbi:nicotinamidase-related amidase [Stella humosa]|uniref:Nicotinamidase-related amidase n=1 Tax=Stella humosa TaxID=94 RepID=A0A3N1KV77_9PROT|nr:cysteine hydrolase family protein [Stella humosa]ROP83382.1 nicotinamidase-related amidase [Stella humosa]BBK29834.1 isochorismatase [Stella humosa]